MHYSPKLLAFAATTLLSSTTSASPLRPSAATPSSPLSSKSVDCNNVETGLAPQCWFTLNMTTYFNNWVATTGYNSAAEVEESSGSTNSSTATTSTTTSNDTDTSNPFADVVTTGSDPSDFFRKRTVARRQAAAAAPASGQCDGGKPFSTCYLQLQVDYAHTRKYDCNKINTAGANGTCPAPKVAEYSNNAKGYYAAWNFYCKLFLP